LLICKFGCFDDAMQEKRQITAPRKEIQEI
jgi:hypothetical protein